MLQPCPTSIHRIGRDVVVVASASTPDEPTAVASAMAAANDAALTPTRGPEPSYRIERLTSTSHSTSRDGDTVVAVVIATYEITPIVYYEPDEA